VIVTGASSGIGEATARLYASRGAHLLLLARNEERLGKVRAAIRSEGGSASLYPVDLADSDQVARIAGQILEREGTPDVLINNAGIGRWRPLAETGPEEARAMIAVPYLAAVYLTGALLPAMLAKKRGAIACIASPGAYFAWPNACTYIAARHAVKGFAEALRQEVKSHGLTVTLVVLGTVETPYWEHNPGSRENLPKTNEWLLPALTPQQAAQAIHDGIERGARTVVRPGAYRALFLLNAIAPRLVASQLRKAAKRAKR
jgi:short-subunit dehydrogenase